MSNQFDKQQENMGLFLFLLSMVLFGLFSLYLWFT